MHTSSVIPSEIVREFQLSDPHFAVETAIARVWRITYLGAPAALKIYHDQTPVSYTHLTLPTIYSV